MYTTLITATMESRYVSSPYSALENMLLVWRETSKKFRKRGNILPRP
jgi:hypothetical protein